MLVFFFYFFLLFTQNARVYGFSVEHALLNEESSGGDSTKFYDDLVTTNIHTFTIFSFFPQALNKNLIHFLLNYSLSNYQLSYFKRRVHIFFSSPLNYSSWNLKKNFL